MEANYQELCNVNDIEEKKSIVVETGGKNILLSKFNGEVYAVENNCTHENLPLNGGEIHEGQIQCPHHGARFNLKTGQATQFPAVMELKTYKTKIDDNKVMVAL